jgi:hypothetical protein
MNVLLIGIGAPLNGPVGCEPFKSKKEGNPGKPSQPTPVL